LSAAVEARLTLLRQRAATTGPRAECDLAVRGNIDGVAISGLLQALSRDPPLRITRLARGVPVGGELEYVDLGTIAQAFRDRREKGSP
jgi:recombination protein RecR